MRFGNRGPRSLIQGRRQAFRPKGEKLEGRLLLAIDLGGQLPPNLPNIATQPFGIDLAGANSNGGAGFSVTDVGDVLGNGFDDFLIGAPTVINSNGEVRPGSGNSSTVYLVFGSNAVTAGNIDWLTLTANQRVGDLGQLGNAPAGQQNPVTGLAGFPFNGIKLITSQTPGSQLGVSVSVVPDPATGLNNILIGAPGERDFNGNNPGTGRAYMIYGSPNLANVPNKTIDLDNPLQNPGVNILTFANNAVSSQTGRAVAGVGDVITDGIPDVAIGAPTATVGGSVNAGAVYVVSGRAISTPQTGTVLLQTVGQNGGTPGVIFTGPASGAQAGFSIAGAGDVNGVITSANQAVDDILIGAPTANGGTGAAYLVYGAINLPALATTSGGVNTIPLGTVGGSNSFSVPGLIVNGAAAGERTGYSVSSAGDFNGDGLSDILIGSPGVNANTGQVLMLYGQSVNGAPLSGVHVTTDYPAASNSVVFDGAAVGALAGFSLTQVGKQIVNYAFNSIAIGSPGFNGGEGGVYLIPGAGALAGTFPLATAESQPVAALLVTLTTTIGTAPAFFGASVSSRLTGTTQKVTADNDTFADVIVGAPGYAVINGRGLDGGAFILEGKFLPLTVPISTAITTQIGIGGPVGPFTVNATNPAALDIFVFSNATITPPFAPLTDINPKTIIVNGVAYPNATIRRDPIDENSDGIPDAIITITPRANLGLNANTTALTISGQTLATSPNANKTFSGSASVTVTNTGGTTGGGTSTGGAALPIGTVIPNAFIPQFGPDHFVPPVSVLSQYDYQAIPLHVALNQYLPAPGFGAREQHYFHPASKTILHTAANGLAFQRHVLKFSVPKSVFTAGVFHPGKTIAFTHKVRVVPTNRQHEVYRPTPLKHPTNAY